MVQIAVIIMYVRMLCLGSLEFEIADWKAGKCPESPRAKLIIMDCFEYGRLAKLYTSSLC